MKTSHSFGVHFTIRKDRVKDGKVQIYACITINKQKCFIALKQKIELKYWDDRRGAGKGCRQEINVVNNYLEEVRHTIGTYYHDLQLKGKSIKPETLKNAFLGVSNNEYTLKRLFNYHDETAKSILKWSTLKHYAVTQRYLLKFIQQAFKVPDIHLNEIDYRFIYDFEIYLRNHRPVDHQKPMNNNGVMKHMIRLKKMIHLAIRVEWIAKDPFVNYKLKIVKVNREHLSEKELSTLENKDLRVERIEIVRDLFVFCSYTGLAYVDAISLNHDNLIQESDGDIWLRKTRQKTNTLINTPLLPQAIRILKKYQFNQRAQLTNTVFPVISNQKVNAYLKEIAAICGINKNITFHLARHTFATTVTLSNGVPIETVSKILGHTKIATTQIYAKVLEKKISDDMMALKKKLCTD